jgi:hypothetical protein
MQHDNEKKQHSFISSLARWSRLIPTDERVEKASFTVILAIANVRGG